MTKKASPSDWCFPTLTHGTILQPEYWITKTHWMKKQKSQTEPWTHIHQTREIPVSQPIWKSGVAAKSLPLYLFIVYYYIAYGCK